MPDPFVVAFVIGVTPSKWARVWNDRMPQQPLTLRAATAAEAVAGLESGDVHAAFLRDPADSASQIRLYEELPVVVIPKDHELLAADELVASDLSGVTVLGYSDDTAADVVELVAANVGVSVMPQSVARATSRKDVEVRPFTGDSTGVSLVWVEKSPEVDELIGIVRGRTVNSSRGDTSDETPVKKLSASQKAAAKKARAAAAAAALRKRR